MEILDIHTHHEAPQPEGIVALRVGTGIRIDTHQRYSAGIHPWDTVAEPGEELWQELESLASRPEIVAIGETGIDLTPHGGPMFRQLQIFKRHCELSERLRKPIVIHDVKGHDIVVGARRDLRPTQNWAIHGFRGKPEVAGMLLRAGCWLSFGAQFNPDTLRVMPEEYILAETDESPVSIEEVIARISNVRGKEMSAAIASNTQRFLEKRQK